jgi:hypothetical protein
VSYIETCCFLNYWLWQIEICKLEFVWRLVLNSKIMAFVKLQPVLKKCLRTIQILRTQVLDLFLTHPPIIYVLIVSKNGHFLNQPNPYLCLRNKWMVHYWVSQFKNKDQYETPCTAYVLLIQWYSAYVKLKSGALKTDLFLVLQASIQVEGINRASPLQTQNFAYKMFSFFSKEALKDTMRPKSF